MIRNLTVVGHSTNAYFEITPYIIYLHKTLSGRRDVKTNNINGLFLRKKKSSAPDKRKQGIKEGAFNIPGAVMTRAYRSTSSKPQQNTMKQR